jgi:hypothetical protein
VIQSNRTPSRAVRLAGVRRERRGARRWRNIAGPVALPRPWLETRRPRQLRHLVRETEAHLRDDADRAAAAGLSQFQAESEAVTRAQTIVSLVVGPAPLIVLVRHESR